MRRGLVVLLVVIAACESRYGAYFAIKGDVAFDKVELYFGAAMDSSGPGSGSAFATPTFGAQSGLIFDRTFDASDVVQVGGQETTFYVPANDANQQLGAYVAAVAVAGDHPVGIAEYFDFTVPSDAVYQYKLKLEPWDPLQAEQWGEVPGCVAWRHTRTDRNMLVAVVHKDDRDCDAMMRTADCNDLCSAQSPACSADQLVCGTNGVCALGCSSSGFCKPTLCLPPTACASPCDGRPVLADRLACGAALTNNHIEIFIERTDTKQVCVTDYMFKPGIPCTMPVIEARDTMQVAGFSYTIAASDNDPTVCVLSVVQSAGVAFGDTAKHHLLISFAPPTLGPRPTTVVGVQPKPNSNVCAISPFYTVTYPMPTMTYACQ